MAQATLPETKHTPGKCRVPMWSGMGYRAGFCGDPAFGDQWPRELLYAKGRLVYGDRPAYCHGPCCPAHGGPKEDEPRVYQDGYTNEGRPMWCAVMPDFVNLQESPAGFDGNAVKALANLCAALSEQEGKR